VEGTVRAAGAERVVNAQLIRVADQAHVWAKRYGAGREEVFGVAAKTSEFTSRGPWRAIS
jgi:TolB-like protein